MKTIEELEQRIMELEQQITDLWNGKHGCIPHPTDVYKPGIWLIKKVDEYQGHMEWLMSEDELQALKDNQFLF